MDIIKEIAGQLHIDSNRVQAVVKLLDEGATIPFISRYRKEATGSLDETRILEISELTKKLRTLLKRKQTILEEIDSQGKLTPDIKQKIEETTDQATLEDIYLPFKPKRRTRAAIAREKGLEPLAKIIMSQQTGNIERTASRFINGNVADTAEVISGAMDIIAEWVSESEKARRTVRRLFERDAVVSSKVIKGKEAEAEKYLNYFDSAEPLRRCSSHRYLAIRRGEKEGFLKVTINIDDDRAIERLNSLFIKNPSVEAAEIVRQAVADGYKRLMRPSIENETAASSREKADEVAIRAFADNLEQLLMAPPLRGKRVLSIDPGFRTGCKIVCLDTEGNLLHNDVIYPTPPKNDIHGSASKLSRLVDSYKIDAISLGNGTASRETEKFLKNVRFNRNIEVFVVSENGASVYSASKIARDEFPDKDVTVRGAVSIGRRLIDPLAELVKIDPKSIGVGQYQHDVDQTRLKDSLDFTVMKCVNSVGVNLNTASPRLLSYVSGIGPSLADNIVEYRRINGPFESRAKLTKVPRLGDKAFEQSAAFLRIPGAANPLDNSAVHPESYHIVKKMADDINVSVNELIGNNKLIDRIEPAKYTTETVGLPTLNDIITELRKPGLDPRTTAEIFEFDPEITDISQLRPGMTLNGIVNNITDFGAFVDLGIHESGLLHISQMSNRRINSPHEILKIHQHIKVKILDVDTERRRISLTIRDIE